MVVKHMCAPPCILHLARPATAGAWHGFPSGSLLCNVWLSVAVAALKIGVWGRLSTLERRTDARLVTGHRHRAQSSYRWVDVYCGRIRDMLILEAPRSQNFSDVV
jgi:hypothetical protein